MSRPGHGPYPWWVRVTFMAGGQRRIGQWAYVGFSLVAAAICAALPVLLELRQSTAIIFALAAVAFLVTAAWYVLSIRWMDRHDAWQL